ncbi:hypothetical protein OG21DRAFT_1490376 [Imleria badia]|nr:hypothetical protein OG21DRAFT_1490376 [Imleria badia]
MSEFRPRMVDKFGSGRAYIAGDAAHVHSPTGGQGLNSSVQDAFNLAWKVALVYKGKGLSPVTFLDSYTKERLPVIAEMLNITGILNEHCSPIVVDEFTQGEPVNAYGLLDEGVLVAGDRTPDATELGLVVAQATGGAETATTVFDVFCSIYHTVLVFAPNAASAGDVLEMLKRYPVDVVRPVSVLAQGSEVTTGAQADVVVDFGKIFVDTWLLL